MLPPEDTLPAYLTGPRSAVDATFPPSTSNVMSWLVERGFDPIISNSYWVMAHDLDFIRTRAEVVFLLPGWSTSTQATWEKEVAEWAGKRVMFIHLIGGIHIRDFPVFTDNPAALALLEQERLKDERRARPAQCIDRPANLPDVGICGAAGAGKDSAAAVLVEEWGYTKIAFADIMRRMARAMDPIVDFNVSGIVRYSDAIAEVGYDEAKVKYPEFRRFLERLGTEGGRDILGQNFWVDEAMKARALIDGPVVFTDVRFWNEFNAIEGGLTITVIRPDLPDIPGEHSSRHTWREFPTKVTITNDSTLVALADQVLAALAA
jgi:hypothetical protein